MDLSDRVVLITGGSRIGMSIATEVARRGAHVALSYKNSQANAEKTVAAIQSLSRNAVAIRADLSRGSECEEFVKASVKAFGRIDVLVNMASLYNKKSFDSLTERDWDLGFTVDVKAAFLCALATVSHMRAVRGGRIINFSDWVAYSGRPRYKGYLPYYVAKAAVVALTEALALELANDKILVNAIAPGPIRPPDNLEIGEVEKIEKATPLGHWGGDSEVVKAVIALIETDFMTGETLCVDGGRHLR